MERHNRAILVDIDGQSARFACSDHMGVSQIQEYTCRDFPTATDCFNTYLREADITPGHHACLMSVSGAIFDDSIRIERCPWIISRRGIGYLLSTQPHIINDTAAKIWACRDARAITFRTLLGSAMPNFSAQGQWATVTFSGGVGAAVMVQDEFGASCNAVTEIGHSAFTPVGDTEKALHQYLARTKQPVSWERALTADYTIPQLDISQNGEAQDLLRAEMLGNFVGDLILSTGAWSGVFITGSSADFLAKPKYVSAFGKRLSSSAHFQRHLKNTPVWSAQIPNMNITGLNAYFKEIAGKLT